MEDKSKKARIERLRALYRVDWDDIVNFYDFAISLCTDNILKSKLESDVSCRLIRLYINFQLAKEYPERIENISRASIEWYRFRSNRSTYKRFKNYILLKFTNFFNFFLCS